VSFLELGSDLTPYISNHIYTISTIGADKYNLYFNLLLLLFFFSFLISTSSVLKLLSLLTFELCLMIHLIYFS
jgi:hypothetical protein